MAARESLPLTKENIASMTLDDLLDACGPGGPGSWHPDKNRIKRLVEAHLRSAYAQQRGYSQVLKDELRVRNVEMGEIAEGETVSTYLRINHKTQWIRVGQYRKSDPVAEREPSISDLKAWAEYPK
jgi:hypothetical protein